MGNKLFAFCTIYQANSPECRILQAQGSLETKDGEIAAAWSAMDQKICETCPDKKFEVERPECVNCGGFLIREGQPEAGASPEYHYKCYKCNLTYSSSRKLE